MRKFPYKVAPGDTHKCFAALTFVFTCRGFPSKFPWEAVGERIWGLSAGCPEVPEVLRASWDKFESVNKSSKAGGSVLLCVLNCEAGGS